MPAYSRLWFIKVSNIAEALGSAVKALRDEHLTIVNVDNVNQLTLWNRHYDYPSREQAVSAVQQRREAEKEYNAALSECRDLGIAGICLEEASIPEDHPQRRQSHDHDECRNMCATGGFSMSSAHLFWHRT